MLGFAVAVLAIVGVVLLKTADDAKDEAASAAARVQSAAGHRQAHASAGTTNPAFTSYARVVGDNAEELAAAHQPFDAALPAAPAGPVVKVSMTIKDMDIEIAPGVNYRAWAFDEAAGTAPGPVIHFREGQTVEMTLVNGARCRTRSTSTRPASRRTSPSRTSRPASLHLPVQGGGSRRLHVPPRYEAGADAHRERDVRRDRGRAREGPAAPGRQGIRAGFERVVLEFRRCREAGLVRPGEGARDAARLVTWNGYADQYVQHLLTAKPGETVRFWVVAAGPSLRTDFHVVGTIFDRAWMNQDLTQYERGVQTVSVPAGGGGVFDVKIGQPGLYPFVSHSFASADLGQVGLRKVGNVKGSMSH